MENIVFNLCDKDITKDLQISSNTNPCNQCGAKEYRLGIGKGPHQASLLCGGCDRFIRWVGKNELVKLNRGGLE
jgi:hypothetical protein